MRCTRGERRCFRALVFLDLAVDFEADDLEAEDLLDFVAVELFLVVEDPCDVGSCEDDCGLACAVSEPD